MKKISLAFIPMIIYLAGCIYKKSAREKIDNTYSSIPIENMILLEIKANKQLQSITKTLPSIQSDYFNSICITLPESYNKTDLKELIDSCHQVGMNFILHIDQPDNLSDDLVRDLSVDGFHCSTSLTKSNDFWQQKISLMRSIKPLIFIGDIQSDDLMEAGFSSCAATGFVKAMDTIIVHHQPVSFLDSALRIEKNLFNSSFRAMRTLNLPDLKNIKAEEAAIVQTIITPGVPLITYSQLEHHRSFIKLILKLYSETTVLQYGDFSIYDSGSSQVITSVRSFKDEIIVCAVNLGSAPSTYKWPTHLMGTDSELLFGEKLLTNGGQVLPAYSYQLLIFRNIKGINILDLPRN